MGATLDETRLELEAQRSRVKGTADQLEAATRRSLDLKAAIGRNPGKTIGLAAGAAFFLLGGPRRTVRFVSRALGGPASGAKAYAALPPSLRAAYGPFVAAHLRVAEAVSYWREAERVECDEEPARGSKSPKPARLR